MEYTTPSCHHSKESHNAYHTDDKITEQKWENRGDHDDERNRTEVA